MKNFGLHIIFCLLVSSVFAQDRLLLTNDFKFENGVYLTLAKLNSNTPLCGWQSVKTEAHIDSDRYQIRLTDLTLNDGRLIKNETIAAIVVDGQPFINVSDMLGEHVLAPEAEQQPTLFVKLQVKGRLSYLYFEGFRKEKTLMNVFDPQRKILIRTQEVEEIKPVVIKKIITLETEEISDYELFSFLDLIKEQDPGLYKTLVDLSKQEARNKLYKSLLIFNDRNPYYLKNNSQSIR